MEPEQRSRTGDGGTQGVAEGSPTAEPVPPQALGWEAVRLLGAGAQAEVWLVRDASGSEAALKVARAGEDDAPILAEADVLTGGEHPHLLRCLGTVPTDRGTGLLSEHRPAGSLADLVRAAGPLTPGQAVTVLVPVAQALAHLHARGVVHGDVSPSNVLFAVDGSPALVDVGVARVLGGPQGVGATPGFAAPEVLDAVDAAGEDGAAAASAVGPPADVHAWGALGWHALTGRAPGGHGHRAPLPVLVPDVPHDLALLLDAALDPDPARRPDAETAAEAAYAAVRPEPVPLHEAAPPAVAHLLPTVLPGRAAGSGRGGSGARRRRGGAGPFPGPGRRRGLPLAAAALGIAAACGLGAVLVAGANGREAGVDGPGTARGASSSVSPEAVSSPASADVGASGGARAEGGGNGEEGSGASTPAAPTPAGAAAALAADPAGLRALLDRVGTARTAALTDPRAERLDAYAAPGSPAWERDRQIQDDLVQGGFGFAGLTVRLEAEGAAVVEGDERLRVPVRLVTGAHTVQDARGAVAERVPERVEPVLLGLLHGDDGWRVERVDPR